MKNYQFELVPLLRVAIFLMVGIIVENQMDWQLPLLWILISGVGVTLLLSRWPLAQSVAIGVCMMLLGMVLTQRQKTALEVAWPAHEVVYDAVVLSDPVEKPKTVCVDVMLIGNQRKLKCYIYKDVRSGKLRVGDGLHIQSRITECSEWRRGTFSYKRYLQIHGFTGTTFVSSWKWHKAQLSLSGLPLLERTKLSFLKYRSQLLERMRASHLSGERYAVASAIALGDKSALSKDLKEIYSRTGASHVLALSGLHLGIVYALCSFLIMGRRWRMASQTLILLAIWAYVFLVGMPVSVVRSAVMLSVYALLSLGHRDKMSVNTLAFAAIVLLFSNPLSLFDVGFQLSFMAVFFILWLVPLFNRVFPEQYLQSHRVVKWLWGIASVSCAAQIGVAPLIAYHFGRFSTCFLLTSYLVIPATTLILCLSMTVLIVPASAILLAKVIACQNAALRIIADIPYANIDHLRPTILQTVMVYVVICAIALLADGILPTLWKIHQNLPRQKQAC